MKDAGFAIAKAYTTLLSGLTYSGRPVEVYGLQAPNNAVAPYVIIGPWVTDSHNTKTSFGQKGQVNLDIVTRFSGPVSKKPASDIADLITQRITPAPSESGLVIDGFQQVVTTISGVKEAPQMSPTDTMVRKIVTISHTLKQV